MNIDKEASMRSACSGRAGMGRHVWMRRHQPKALLLITVYQVLHMHRHDGCWCHHRRLATTRSYNIYPKAIY